MKNELVRDHETEFLSGLIELQYGLNVVDKLVSLTQYIPWAKGWPDNKESFWNAEAFMGSNKISKRIRDLIQQEIKFLDSGNNLDLGCGSYSYIPSTGFDLSQKMLDFNGNCLKKVQGDLEKDLPFQDNYFDSVTAIFVLNYVLKFEHLIHEISKVMNDNGTFVMILSSHSLTGWQKRKEINIFSEDEWKEILKLYFVVDSYKKDDLLFFKCKKIGNN